MMKRRSFRLRVLVTVAERCFQPLKQVEFLRVLLLLLMLLLVAVKRVFHGRAVDLRRQLTLPSVMMMMITCISYKSHKTTK